MFISSCIFTLCASRLPLSRSAGCNNAPRLSIAHIYPPPLHSWRNAYTHPTGGQEKHIIFRGLPPRGHKHSNNNCLLRGLVFVLQFWRGDPAETRDEDREKKHDAISRLCIVMHLFNIHRPTDRENSTSSVNCMLRNSPVEAVAIRGTHTFALLIKLYSARYITTLQFTVPLFFSLFFTCLDRIRIFSKIFERNGKKQSIIFSMLKKWEKTLPYPHFFFRFEFISKGTTLFSILKKWEKILPYPHFFSLWLWFRRTRRVTFFNQTLPPYSWNMALTPSTKFTESEAAFA